MDAGARFSVDFEGVRYYLFDHPSYLAQIS
jgi:hypothetical protein